MYRIPISISLRAYIFIAIGYSMLSRTCVRHMQFGTLKKAGGATLEWPTSCFLVWNGCGFLKSVIPGRSELRSDNFYTCLHRIWDSNLTRTMGYLTKEYQVTQVTVKVIKVLYENYTSDSIPFFRTKKFKCHVIMKRSLARQKLPRTPYVGRRVLRHFLSSETTVKGCERHG